MTRIALGLSYHGQGFCGWQSQKSGTSVQDTLECALKNIAQHTIRVHAAGRTDAGVHATAQVIHFDTQADRPIQAWVRGVNRYLPPSIRVLWAKCVAVDFHARFSARRRYYHYLLYNTSTHSAIWHALSGWYHMPLDVTRMQAGAKLLLGEHDFSAFRSAECQAKNAIRTLYTANIAHQGFWIVFSFSANAFLQHQVRNMVGALVMLGSGRQSLDEFAYIFAQGNRQLAPPTFSANGLYLTGVEFDKRWDMPSVSADFPITVLA